MNNYYGDILSRITNPPLWFDENAVPRFDPFTPHNISDIYADEACLVLISCQGCGHEFHVSFSSSRMSRARAGAIHGRDNSLTSRISNKTLHYGDPPNINCCGAGNTMNSIPQKVLEFWSRENFTWVRQPAQEVEIMPEWARDPE